jgi:hypothetical protein
VSVLTGYLHDALNDALLQSDIPMDCVVTRQETSGPPFNPTIVNVSYPAAGWVDSYSTLDHVNSAVLVSDRKIFIIASTLAITPAPPNTVTIAGATYSIISVERDPAGAAWVCQCRV